MLVAPVARVEAHGLAFVARMIGENIVVELEDDASVYARGCEQPVRFEKWSEAEATWVAVPDDRYFRGLGYYIDGAYQPDFVARGCDYAACLPQGRFGVSALEWVQIGARPAPPSALVLEPPRDSPARVIETRALSGRVRIAIEYALVPGCDEADLQTVELELEIPREGVCCPVGCAGCDAEGPAGGWAPSLAACRPHFRLPGDHHQAVIDAHGCEALMLRGLCGDLDAQPE